jgi:hypothetical protein
MYGQEGYDFMTVYGGYPCLLALCSYDSLLAVYTLEYVVITLYISVAIHKFYPTTHEDCIVGTFKLMCYIPASCRFNLGRTSCILQSLQ